jgi:arsenate reductase (thioredoxin)
VKKKVLVLCTANSCRSQIAHGYLNYFGNKELDVYSAGVDTQGVNPRAIAVMKEDGVDISHHTSNHVNEYTNVEFDFVITVCDNARENCPYFPARIKNLHYDFPDPAQAKGSEEEIMNQFRMVRDMIRKYTREFIQSYVGVSS